MSNDVTRQPMDLYEKYAAEAAAVGGPRLKFVKGVFKIGDDVVDLNTEFIALMADVAQSWVRFEDGKLTHSLLYKLADGFEPCQREELGDPKATWKWTGASRKTRGRCNGCCRCNPSTPKRPRSSQPIGRRHRRR